MRYFVLVLTLLVASCSGNKAVNYTKYVAENSNLPDIQKFVIKVQEAEIPFHGYPNFDKQNSSGAMMYPGGTPELFFVAVLTHAAIQSSVDQDQVDKIQVEADKVLEPYNAIVHGIQSSQYVDAAIESLNEKLGAQTIAVFDPAATDQIWVLSSEPILYLLPDEKSILIRNVVKLTGNNNPSDVIYQNLVEVLSDSFEGDDVRSYWNRENGIELQRVVQQLFTDSVELAIQDIGKQFANSGQKEKTFSFLQAGIRTYQRGTLLANSCNRTAIRTLRGWIKSFPEKSTDIACTSLSATEISH